VDLEVVSQRAHLWLVVSLFGSRRPAMPTLSHLPSMIAPSLSRHRLSLGKLPRPTEDLRPRPVQTYPVVPAWGDR
jgi:hypothetical protein